MTEFISSELLLRIISAIVAVTVFSIAGHYLVGRLLSRITRMETSFVQRLGTVISIFLYIIGVVTALSILSLSYAALELAFIVIALMLLIAFRDLLANMVGEAYIRFRTPFSEGELIRVGDIEGRVAAIRTLDVELVNPQGERIIVPNSYFLKGYLVKKTRVVEGVSEFSIMIRGIVHEEVESTLEEALQAIRPELSGDGEIRQSRRRGDAVRVTIALPLINLLKTERLVNEFVENIRGRGYKVEVI